MSGEVKIQNYALEGRIKISNGINEGQFGININ